MLEDLGFGYQEIHLSEKAGPYEYKHQLPYSKIYSSCW